MGRQYAVTAEAAAFLPDSWIREIVDPCPRTRGPAPLALADRFWPKVNVGGPDDCWPWMGVRTHYGHGQIKPSGIRSRECGMLGAHVASWLLNVGRVPIGLQVLHRCDNPPCCNPRHLFLGTQQDNVEDMDTKGRRRVWHPAGEVNPASKLKEADVREIKALLPFASKAFIARTFDVSAATVTAIDSGETWGWVR